VRFYIVSFLSLIARAGKANLTW